MSLSHSPLWTLDELSDQVAQALAVDYPGQASGRVREMPDIRTIRYYTTRGLIDRPAQMRGRTALYCRRHLLQLVAIKRLQAEGLSLTEIQKRVTGQTNAVLSKLARVPVRDRQAEETNDAARPQMEQTAEDRRNGNFWGASPAPVPEVVQTNGGRPVFPLAGVTLDEGVTLLLEAARPLDELDVEALRSAAVPLLKTLRERRIRVAEC
ncbi:MAG TPA: MerR family transcriptional regulator [Gemmataceae bacterium]|jgi:DNA-binding transcriptional MerR regulator